MPPARESARKVLDVSHDPVSLGSDGDGASGTDLHRHLIPLGKEMSLMKLACAGAVLSRETTESDIRNAFAASWKTDFEWEPLNG